MSLRDWTEMANLEEVVPNPWLHRYLYLNSVPHEMKQKDVNVGTGGVERREVDRSLMVS